MRSLIWWHMFRPTCVGHGDVDSTLLVLLVEWNKKVAWAIKTLWSISSRVSVESFGSTAPQHYKEKRTHPRKSYRRRKLLWNFLSCPFHTQPWWVELDGLYNQVHHSLTETFLEKKSYWWKPEDVCTRTGEQLSLHLVFSDCRMKDNRGAGHKPELPLLLSRNWRKHQREWKWLNIPQKSIVYSCFGSQPLFAL